MKNMVQFYINGEWVDPVIPNTADVYNPSNGEICGQISMGSKDDVDRAVKAANDAFNSFSSSVSSLTGWSIRGRGGRRRDSSAVCSNGKTFRKTIPTSIIAISSIKFFMLVC